MNRRVKQLLLLALAFACAWIIVSLVGSIDWAEVVSALGRLAWWQFPLLLAVLLARQYLNAYPLAIFITGLGGMRALANDLTAALLALIAPPPSDMVVRVAMFRSWGIDSSRAIAGAAMNSAAFYINRFAAPILGTALVFAFELESRHWWSAAVSAAVATVLALVVSRVVRAERAADQVGRIAASVARRLGRDADPDAWAAATLEFRDHMRDKYARGLPRALLTLVAMVVVDGLLLLLALRSVGVQASDVSSLQVLGSFLLAYPLTLFPLMGLGIVDAVLLAVFVEVGGLAIEPEVVAGLVVWRAYTLIVPALLGIGTLGFWRRSAAGRHELAEAEPAGDRGT